MNSIAQKKKELEIKRVELGLMETEFRLMEAEATVDRLKAQVLIQKEKLEELKNI